MKNQNYLLYLYFILLCGCGLHSYSPPLTYIPVKANPGELSSSATVGMGGANLNVNYGLSEHFGISTVAHTNIDEMKTGSRVNRKIFEVSGYCFPLKTDELINFGIMIGGGLGSYTTDNKKQTDVGLFSTNYDYFVDSKIRYSHFFVAPFISFSTRKKVFECGIGVKARFINHSKYEISYVQSYSEYDSTYVTDFDYYDLNGTSRTIIEPVFKCTISRSRVKPIIQISFPVTISGQINSTNYDLIINDPVAPSVQFGVVYVFKNMREKSTRSDTKL